MRRPAVYLIGTGPGDPGLITARGLDCLRQADVVVHDHTTNPRLLEQARPGAEVIDVGSTGSQPLAQEAISYLLAEKAREGRLVARLKRGDPFVFDRGGEEALFLHEQRVPYEVVPGIPGGIGVPAYAGIPVTYPGAGDTITLVRGYEDENRAAPDVNWSSLVKLDGTIVCYAAASQLPHLLHALSAHGCRDEQAVVVYDGTLPTQQTLTGSVGELIGTVRAHHRRQPAILVVGRVVSFREHLRWFDARPLFGRRVLVTRPREQAAELSDRLSAFGAEAIEAPMIRIVPPDDLTPLRAAAADTDAFDLIVFTSGNAVDAFMAALLTGNRDVRALRGPRLCAVGSATADRLATYGIKVDLVPQEFRAEHVVPLLAEHVDLDGLRVLLPRADIGRELIADQLRAAGARVTDVIAYKTVLEEGTSQGAPDVYRMLLDGRLDVVTFTSASAVRNFARMYGRDEAIDLLKHTVVAAIGPVTAEAATQMGVRVAIQPATYTVPALVDAIAAYFTQTPAST